MAGTRSVEKQYMTVNDAHIVIEDGEILSGSIDSSAIKTSQVPDLLTYLPACLPSFLPTYPPPSAPMQRTCAPKSDARKHDLSAQWTGKMCFLVFEFGVLPLFETDLVWYLSGRPRPYLLDRFGSRRREGFAQQYPDHRQPLAAAGKLLRVAWYKKRSSAVQCAALARAAAVVPNPAKRSTDIGCGTTPDGLQCRRLGHRSQLRDHPGNIYSLSRTLCTSKPAARI
eukprot:1619026-Rhodomonas_salina.4